MRALQSQPSYQQDSQKDVGENGCEVYHLKKYEQIKPWELAFEKGGFFKESGFFFLKGGGVSKNQSILYLVIHAMETEYTIMDIHGL